MLAQLGRERSAPWVTRLAPIWIAFVAAVAAYALSFDGDCSAAVAFSPFCGLPRVLTLCGAIAAAPLFAYAFILRPVTVALSAYAIIVPFEEIITGGTEGVGAVAKLVGAFCAIVILLALLFQRERRRSHVVASLPMLCWSGMLLYCAATLAWSIDPALSGLKFLSLLQYVGLYACIAAAPLKRRDMLILLAATAGGGILAGAYSGYAAATGHGVFIDGRLFLSTDITGVADPNHIAAALLLPSALLLSAVIWSRSTTLRLAALAGLPIILVAVLLSGSRGAIVALCSMVIFLAIRARASLRILLPVGAAILTAILIPNPLFARFTGDHIQDGAGRLGIWHVALPAFAQHWLFGAGYATFPAAYDQAFFLAYQAYFVRWHMVSHNLLVSTGVELGIVGLGIVALAWIVQFRALRVVGGAGQWFAVRASLEAALLGLAVASLFLDIMREKYLWLAFAEATLLVAVVLRERASERSSQGSALTLAHLAEYPEGPVL